MRNRSLEFNQVRCKDKILDMYFKILISELKQKWLITVKYHVSKKKALHFNIEKCNQLYSIA